MYADVESQYTLYTSAWYVQNHEYRDHNDGEMRSFAIDSDQPRVSQLYSLFRAGSPGEVGSAR